jgi:hypothetical protein
MRQEFRTLFTADEQLRASERQAGKEGGQLTILEAFSTRPDRISLGIRRSANTVLCRAANHWEERDDVQMMKDPQ